MKILLVEDVRAIAAVMAARLQSFGHQVVLAGNGEDAVALFQQECPDLVLMDIELPGINGFEATNRIRAYEAMQRWAWTPILFLTASDTAENLVMAIEAGADDFLSKSVPEPVLQAKMQAMARIAALRQRLAVANRRLEELSKYDGLTGLYNRRQMDLEVDHAWADAVQNRRSFAVLMLDIDHFKQYNDHYGHAAGDVCLKQVGAAIGEAVVEANASGLTSGAFVARYGGEEFAVVIPQASAEAYAAIAQAILTCVRQLALPHAKSMHWGVVTVSLGGERTDCASGKVAAIFRRADARLYLAKQNGRNRSCLDEEPGEATLTQ